MVAAKSRGKRTTRSARRSGANPPGSQRPTKHDLAAGVKHYLADPRVTHEPMAKRRPTGQFWPVGPTEKKWAREQMIQRGITQADLSRLVKTSTAMISMFFDETTDRPVRQSRLWPRIVEVLGGKTPTVTSPSGDGAHHIDEAKKALLENWEKLTDADRAIVNDLVRALTAKRQ